jgi:hypothetical protein
MIRDCQAAIRRCGEDFRTASLTLRGEEILDERETSVDGWSN